MRVTSPTGPFYGWEREGTENLDNWVRATHPLSGSRVCVSHLWIHTCGWWALGMLLVYREGDGGVNYRADCKDLGHQEEGRVVQCKFFYRRDVELIFI